VNLANLLRPAYRHSNAAVRRRAVAGVKDEAILVDLACEDPDLEVRRLAVQQLQSSDSLRRVAIEGTHLDARLNAVHRIDDPWMLAGILRERKNPDLMLACFRRIDDQAVLEAIARDPAYNVATRRLAINMFADTDLLRDLIDSLQAPGLRRAALERVAGEDDAQEAAEPAAGEEDGTEEQMERILSHYDPEAVAEMLGALRDSPAAVQGLGTILRRGGAAGERAVEILGRFLRHASPHMRLEALEQLRPRLPEMGEELKQMADSDPDPRVRGRIRRLLSEVEPPGGE
jgi:hypothetical protein